MWWFVAWLVLWLICALYIVDVLFQDDRMSGKHGSSVSQPATRGAIYDLTTPYVDPPLVISRPTIGFEDAEKLWRDHPPDVIWDTYHTQRPIAMTERGRQYVESLSKDK